jgi:hypothetical protein
MTNLLRQMRGRLDLHDLLLIVSIALSIPLRLALPLAQMVCRRIDICLAFGDQDTGNTTARLLSIPS